MSGAPSPTAAPRALPADDQPLRIAWLIYRGNPHCGGQGVYVRHLSRELHALGHEVDVLSGQPYPELDLLGDPPSMDRGLSAGTASVTTEPPRDAPFMELSLHSCFEARTSIPNRRYQPAPHGLWAMRSKPRRDDFPYLQR